MGYQPPTKLIFNQHDLGLFLKSRTVTDLKTLIRDLSEGVHGVKLSEPCNLSPEVQRLLDVFDVLEGWLVDCPPIKHGARYGNMAFRSWCARLDAAANDLMEYILPAELNRVDAASELAPYFKNSFGNSWRIDYGTGHENTFLSFILCLGKLGVCTKTDHRALVTRVFAKYLSLMRQLQTTYWLEPAGSHGVWGLDDYCFLPFYWGAAQLSDLDKIIRPHSIHDDGVLHIASNEYLYFSCIKFVKQVKRGALSETSPMLNDISGVLKWTKVNSGLLKMYEAECLAKLPVMQHFLFGSILTLQPCDASSV